jgi:SAM-dependent methyltransferase
VGSEHGSLPEQGQREGTVRRGPAPMASLQERMHDAGHDYDVGSPHLRHPGLRNEIVARIRSLVTEQHERRGSCRVLEIGAGHGSFTDHVAAMGAEITVTEMSRPSLDSLRSRFAYNPSVRLVYDPDGERVFSDDAEYDLVLCISVLHHIPDYLGFVARLVDRVEPGGSFASFQDPLWYRRQGRVTRAFDKTAYYAWRLGQRNVRRGVSTRLRRIRGVYDVANPADMVEYHVVRDGVDETALKELLSSRFPAVELWTYWSTQAPLLQVVGERLGAHTTFGLVGRSRLAHPA